MSQGMGMSDARRIEEEGARDAHRRAQEYLRRKAEKTPFTDEWIDKELSNGPGIGGSVSTSYARGLLERIRQQNAVIRAFEQRPIRTARLRRKHRA